MRAIETMSRSKLFSTVFPHRICLKKNKQLPGFTLIEILLTLAIVGIMASLAVPLYTGSIEKARRASATGDIQAISLALTGFFADNSIYPESLAEVRCSTYLDPWGHPYQYLNIKTAKSKSLMRKDRFLVPINSDFDLYSMGKDGQSEPPLTSKTGRDDIIRANNGAYIGPAYAF